MGRVGHFQIDQIRMTRTPPLTRAAFRHFETIPTRWKDNDAYGHVNNATYLSFFDTAITLWQLGQGMDVTGAGGLRFLAAANGCTYHAEARFPDLLHAGLRVVHLGRSSVRYEIGIFRNDEDSAATEGFFVHVCVDPKSRPQPIPGRERAMFETLLVATDHGDPV